jgi:DNA-binding CsgD family transcriptional regulator/GAF domain-containing protein
MNALKQFSELTAVLYDTVLEPQRWPEALRKIGAALRSASAIIAVHPWRGGVDWVAISGLDPVSLPRYEEGYASADTNPYLKLCRVIPLGEPISAEVLEAPRSFEQTEFFRTILAPQRLRHSVILTLMRDEERVAAVAFLRGADAGDFEHEELELLRELGPHLSRALKLGMRMGQLEGHASALAAALSTSATGMLLVDASGRVIFLNPAAAALFRRDDGLALTDGSLDVRDPAARRSLADRLARSVVDSSAENGLDKFAAFSIPRPSGEESYRAVVWPLKVTAGSARVDAPSALVLLDDPRASPRAALDTLAAIYRLTPTETQLAALLTQGLTLSEAATRMSVSINTVKTHLKQLFAKTTTRRQADLLRFILQFPPHVARPKAPDA